MAETGYHVAFRTEDQKTSFLAPQPGGRAKKLGIPCRATSTGWEGAAFCGDASPSPRVATTQQRRSGRLLAWFKRRCCCSVGVVEVEEERRWSWCVRWSISCKIKEQILWKMCCSIFVVARYIYTSRYIWVTSDNRKLGSQNKKGVKTRRLLERKLDLVYKDR